MTTPADPLSAPYRVLDPSAGRITTATAISPGEPIFAGHCPSFPILPGVLLIKTVNRTVRDYAAEVLGREARLPTLHAARLLAPKSPGDDVLTQCRTDRGRVASVRAAYALG